MKSKPANTPFSWPDKVRLTKGNIFVSLLCQIDPLIPFTHWITPTTNHRRYTTQMYLYFLPLSPESKSIIGSEESDVQAPTSDGGLEITEARFLPASEWLRLAKNGDVIMFPPQAFLLSFVAQFLERPGESATAVSKEESTRRRAELVGFVHSGSPPWTDKFISPTTIGHATDGRSILRLDYVGPELQGSAKKGEPDRVVLVRFCKEGPREVEVRWRNEVVLGKKPAQSSL
ncbi:NUDIX family hydrolase [Histoplasma capsulatum var. duboisii H88]|uniref:NUDIX family hydrolase n=1 Tax=Ajellomyces capsulatus (strain H88) TaxID=544711 RepID=A0A8A1LQM3_AJEC8|nr:NUDIX family hydrolase [Histoplasma capsulatum var. duboisii H88]